MSNSPPTPDSAAAGGRPRLTAGALLDRATRVAVMLVIAAAGLVLLRSYQSMLHDAPAVPVNKPEKKPEKVSGTVSARGPVTRTETVPDTFLLRPGAWTLGESNWTIALHDLSAPDNETRLRSLGPSATIEPPFSSLEQKALTWLRRVQPVVKDGFRIYEIPIGAIQARIVTQERKGRERVRLVQLLLKKGGSAQLLEAAPAPGSGKRGSDEGHLLPLPDGVASLARRWDDAARLTCEILGPASVEDCLRQWSAAGWMAEKMEGGHGPFFPIVLRNGSHRVELCTIETGPSGSPAYLLLTTSPAN